MEAKHLDIYGPEITILMLKKEGYNLVSFRQKSIPSAGSPCYPIERLNTPNDMKILRTINHKQINTFVVLTNYGYLKFWK